MYARATAADDEHFNWTVKPATAAKLASYDVDVANVAEQEVKRFCAELHLCFKYEKMLLKKV